VSALRCTRISGDIVGTVTDATGAVVAGAIELLQVKRPDQFKPSLREQAVPSDLP
jgi:hypothetical protein